jgi:hypothetical protein
MSGCSSGVEHNLAKVGVEGSNPFARSNFPIVRPGDMGNNLVPNGLSEVFAFPDLAIFP